MDAPLPWERLLWSSGSRRLRARYFITDFRLVRAVGGRLDELALTDIGEVHRVESLLDWLFGTSTIVVDARNPAVPSLVLTGVKRGAQVAALIELVAGDPLAAHDVDAIRAALAWDPREPPRGARLLLVAIAAALTGGLGVVVLHGHPRPVLYSAVDPIAPNGEKRSRSEIGRFMEAEVMPWARAALGPIKGGANRIGCETCHGRNPSAIEWQMPAVAALPLPALRVREGQNLRAVMDAQIRNAIYGYVAESDKQSKATYMREVVMPGMARLLHRPPYDFTRPYDENRARHALGCYHCHRVK